MHIELSSQDLDDLRTALEHYVRQVQEDLIHADVRDFREETRRTLTRLERLQARLTEPTGEARPS